jgi:hypothetical protein
MSAVRLLLINISRPDHFLFCMMAQTTTPTITASKSGPQ